MATNKNSSSNGKKVTKKDTTSQACCNVDIVKSVYPTAATPGTRLTYTVMIYNNVKKQINNVTITDFIPIGTTLISGSVKLNDTTPLPDNIYDGINIGPIDKSGQAKIEFQVYVNTYFPVITPIESTAEVDIEDFNNQPCPTVTSNTVYTIVYDTSRGVAFI